MDSLTVSGRVGGKMVSQYLRTGTQGGLDIPSVPISFPGEDYTHQPLRKGKPKFVDEGYASIFVKALLKGKPVKGFNRAMVKFLYRNSQFARDIIDNPGGEIALYDIYNFIPKESRDSSPDGLTRLDEYLLSLRACKGTRRRKDEYLQIYRERMEESFEKDRELEILELGSGRGEIIMKEVKDFISCGQGRDGKVHLLLVDKDPNALELAKTIRVKYGLEKTVDIKCYDAREVSSRESKEGFNQCGTHGFMDYLTDAEAIDFFGNVGHVTSPGRYIITTNMMPHNDWQAQFAMERFGNWMLKYRMPEPFRKLLVDSEAFEIVDTRVVSDKATHILNGKKNPDITEGFHVILTGEKYISR